MNLAASAGPTITGLGAGILASGLAILALRAGLGIEGDALWWALVAIPIGVVAGAIVGWTRRVSSDHIAAIADARVHGGGQIMEDPARNDAALSRAIDELRVDWRFRDVGLLTACGVAILIGAVLMPVSPGASGGTLDLSRQADALREDVEALEDARAITEEQAQDLQRAIDPLEETAARGDVGARWEALDAASEQVERAALAGTEKLGASMAKSSAVEAFAQQMAGDSALSPDMAATVGAALADAVPKLDLPPELAEAMKEAAQSMCNGSSGAREALQKLAEKASQCSGGSRASLESLMNKGLATSMCLGKAGADAAEARLALAKYLSENCKGGSCTKTSLLAGLIMCAKPGTGGITRGPGAANLSWTDEADPTGTRFASERLDGQVDPTDSTLVATMLRLPNPDDLGDGSGGGTLDQVDPASASARTPIVLPRHRDVVRRYFERERHPPTKSE